METANTLSENIQLKNAGGGTTVVTLSVGASGFINFDMINLLITAPAWRNSLSITSFGSLQSLTGPVQAAICNGKLNADVQSQFSTMSEVCLSPTIA